MIEQHIATYREEASELLVELEASLLELEESPDDIELIGRVFRAMHTIKGSGAMFGFDDIAAFTHEVETVFDLVRNGKLAVKRELLDLTLRACDNIKSLLNASITGEKPDSSVGDSIIRALRAMIPSDVRTGDSLAPAKNLEGKKTGDDLNVWRIRFKPNHELFLAGANPSALLNELRQLGICRIIAHNDLVPSLEEMNPEYCYLYWDILLTSARGIEAVKDVFIFVEDDCDLRIELVDHSKSDASDAESRKLGDILVERGDMEPSEMQRILGMQKRFGELAVEAGVVTSDKVQAALAEQQQVKALHQDKGTQDAAASIRVPADKLDLLVNLVGELVTVQAHLTQTAAGHENSDFVAIAEEVERLTNELRDTALNIRMLPIGSTFSKFRRLVRDLSQELGKKIEMDTSGADTELDKTVIERLNDPMVHLIRNSIDHGIEMPDERLAAGKPPVGKVSLGAVHSGDSVLITIMDDGAGLDRDKILNKGIERGLVPSGAELSDKDVYNLIFAPGFSTAEKVTSVSGRGVGMDVVKKGIEALRGSIEINSSKGEGSVITLKIPLTLAIIESLLVRIGESFFVLPLASVEECVELSRKDVSNSHGRNLAAVRGAIVPYISLREQFGTIGDPPEIEQIVIALINGKKIGFVVDSVIGEHQTVIKSLGRVYRDIRGISGATILGDGAVALILDMPLLLNIAEERESMSMTNEIEA